MLETGTSPGVWYTHTGVVTTGSLTVSTVITLVYLARHFLILTCAYINHTVSVRLILIH